MTSVERRSSSSGVSDGSEAFVLVRGRAEGASSASMRIVSRVAEKCRSSVDIVDIVDHLLLILRVRKTRSTISTISTISTFLGH